MNLTLDPGDLREEFTCKDNEGHLQQAISTPFVTFEKLKPRAQRAVIAVGGATFYPWDQLSYQAISPNRP